MSTVKQVAPPSPTSPAPKARGPVPQPARGKRVLLRFLLVVLLAGGFGVGVLLSRMFWKPGAESAHPENPEGGSESESGAEPSGDSGTLYARIDAQIRAGHHDQALALCKEGARRNTGVALDALDYRAALCLEVRGEREKALGIYGSIVNRTPDTRAAAAASLGQARCWLRQGKIAEARTLLNTMLLRSALPAYAEHELLTDAAYLLAFAIAPEMTREDIPSAVRPLALARARLDIPIETLLDWVTPEGGTMESRSNDGVEGRIETRRLGTRVEEVSVTVTATQERLAGFFDRLGEKCGLKIKWSAESRPQAENHIISVVVEQMPLPELVRGLALDANLGWELAEGVLTLTPASAEEKSQRVNAGKLLRAALLAAPDHALAPMAMLELGNLEVTAGHAREGLSWYERMLTQSQRGRIPAQAYYNLALARLLVGDRPQARDAFYWVTDRAPSSDLAFLAYLQIGRQYLSENDANAAMRPLRRALAAPTGSTTRSAAALLLAAASLFTDNPRAAYSTLAEIGAGLNDESFRRPAALLDALARYRARGDSRESVQELGDLLGALPGYREEPILGEAGLLLAGRAYRDLGMIEDMVALYQRSTPKPESALGQEMALDLGEFYFEKDKRQEARQQFEPVAAAAGRRAAQAELRLAWLDLRDRHFDDCIRRCRGLLTTGAGDRKETLALMGKAYSQKGDNVRAARCLAGDIPD
jgi:tetratricopeptide (TPR) repeat protein